MKTWRSRRIATRACIWVAAIVVIGGCSENTSPTPKALGILRVVTTTSGGDPDDDGYNIVVDGNRSLLVGFDRIAFFDSVSAGTHTVALEGVADNCDSVTARSVDVVAAETATVTFDVKCEATGVQITSQTAGPDYGPFQVTIGGRTGSIAANGTLTLTRLTPGTQTLALVNLPGVCGFMGDQSTIVNVTNRTITPVTVRVSCGASDKVLAFVRDDFRGGFIVLSRLDGSSGDTIVKGNAPAWAPDGGKIMYSNVECLSYGYYSNEVVCSGGLFILNPESRLSTPVPSGQNGQDPAWSPDGKSIVFRKVDRIISDPSRLYLLKLDGSSFPVELKMPTVDAKNPAWSPDGLRIAFQCLVPGADGFTHNEICTINSDGARFTQLTSDQGVNLRPAWSPDGRRIAFSTLRYHPKDSSEPDLASMSADGSNITRIASGSSPAWSPDGSKLLYNRLDGLFMSNPDGSTEVRITSGRHRYAAWRPSGPSIWDY